MNDSARVAAELDRFRHLTFLGDRATNPAPDQPRLECARLPTHDVDLDGESVRFYGELFARWGLLATRYRNSILARRQAACLRAMRPDPRGTRRR